MGRELRRVAANWEHPKTKKYDFYTQREVESYVPMFDEAYITQLNCWIEQHALWEKGEHPDQKPESPCRYYAEWNGNPPDVEAYRPNWTQEEMSWFQVYETVSEGTPVTPAFATREELVDYLVDNGDFWDQQRRKEGRSVMSCDPWPREQAEKFVFGHGFAVSMVLINGELKSGVEAL